MIARSESMARFAMKSLTSPFTAFLCVGLSVVIVIGLVQKAPIPYPDTNAYYKAGMGIADFVRPYLTFRARLAEMPQAESTLINPSTSAVIPKSATMGAAARSPFYSIFLFSIASIAGAWTYILIQTLICLGCIWLLLDAAGVARRWRLCGFLAVSTLPAFAIFLMPDIFLSIGIIAAIILIAVPPIQAPIKYLLILTCLLLSASFHTSNGLILVALAMTSGFTNLYLKWGKKEQFSILGIALVLICGLTGFVAIEIYPVAAKAIAHTDIYSPPFLTARYFADGPEERFLQKACSVNEAAFAMCPYRNVKVASSDDLLWNKAQFYQTASYETRVRLALDDKRLFLAALLGNPIDMTEASLINVLSLLPKHGVDEVFAGAQEVYRRPDMVPLMRILPDNSRCFGFGKECVGIVSITAWNIVIEFETIVALAILIGLFSIRRSDIIAYKINGLILIAIFINSVVCGGLSGPAERYQSRVIWLISLAAIIAYARSRLEAATLQLSNSSNVHIKY